jgi:hypothetical protein
MAWGQPKRNGKNICGHRGQCSCQRRLNEEAARQPEDLPTHCTRMCGWQKNKACGRMARQGVCPCPNC